MNMTVTLQLENMPEDTDPDEVICVLRACANEWLDFDRNPENLTVNYVVRD
jgi:hypothetical protein